MMRASVKTDKATRAIELELEADGPAWDMYDLTATWRAEDKRRIFRPDHVRVVAVLGENDEGATIWETSSISVSGQLVLKSGAVSTAQQSRDRMSWTAKGYLARERISLAPEWVQEIARQAPLGITAYTWTDSERAEEVQAL